MCGMELEAVLARLSDALAAAGVERPQPPASSSALEQLEAAIAPLRLPADVRWFWERVDADTLRVEPYPQLHGPAMALAFWVRGRDEFPGQNPEVLLQIAYTSHQCMSVDLDVGAICGGTLFEWNLVDGEYERRYGCLAEWLDEIAGRVEAGDVRRADYHWGQALIVPDRYPPPRPATAAAHPVYGEAPRIGRHLRDWPEHWRRTAGVDLADYVPRGATHTIAELLASPPQARVRGTILARAVGTMGAILLARYGGPVGATAEAVRPAPRPL
jgi:hypothetical protein